MKLDHPDNIALIALDRIEVGPRIRALSDAAVAAIRASVEELGYITTPIHVRDLGDGLYTLIDGRHRLEVARQLENVAIPARIWSCSAAEARLMEGDANLATAHLSPLELALSLAERKRAYVALHPETARGTSGGLARHGSATDIMSFAGWMAALFGITDRQVRRIVAAGERLDPASADALRAAPRRVAMSDLYQIAKLEEAAERDDVVQALAEGRARTAAQARAQLADPKPPRAPNDQALARLLDAWRRAPKAVRRMFLEEEGEAVTDLLSALHGGEEDDGGTLREVLAIARGELAS